MWYILLVYLFLKQIERVVDLNGVILSLFFFESIFFMLVNNVIAQQILKEDLVFRYLDTLLGKPIVELVSTLNNADFPVEEFAVMLSIVSLLLELYSRNYHQKVVTK